MKTDSKILMMTTKQIKIINNYYDNNQHNHNEANSSDTNEDVVRISKMTTTMTLSLSLPPLLSLALTALPPLPSPRSSPREERGGEDGNLLTLTLTLLHFGNNPSGGWTSL
jgi:hypothetical protein